MTKQLPPISRFRSVFLVPIFFSLLSPSHILAEESVTTEEWDITADKIIRYDKPASIVAEGNIVLEKRRKVPPQPAVKSLDVSDWSFLLEEEAPSTEVTPADLPEEAEDVYVTEVIIKADWVAYDVTLGVIRARGNVSVTSDDEQLLAEQAVVNLEQETGTFRNATIIRDKDDMHLEGEVIEKTGYKTYHIENGWVITCKVADDETPPWSFAASDAVIEQDGYATLTHARFQIKDVPVLYSPWLIVPVKNKRQSGFLLPELSTSENDGFGFNLPFFWNISDSTDMTIYTEYMVDRGYMPGLEFRYIKEDSDKGMAFANYLSDDLSSASETEYYRDTGFTHDNQDRYWLRAKADHDFGDDWTSRLDLDIVSDRDYLTEFKSGLVGFDYTDERFFDAFGRGLANRTDDQRPNSLSVLRSWGAMSLTGDLLAINDVRADKSGPSPLWKLPAMEFTGALPFENFGNFTLEWDTDYANFWREEGVGGQRLDLYPRLSAPLPLSQYLESRAEVGVRDTLYVVESYGDEVWENDDTQNRLLYDFHTDIGTTLMRDFALSDSEYSAFSHQVRPYIEYDFIPDVDQDDLPMFDSTDRVGETNGVTYGVDNFFDLLDDSSIARSFGYLEILQSYSFLDDNSDEPFSDVMVRLLLTPYDSLYFNYKTNISVYDGGFVRHNLETYYSSSRGDYFSLEYVFDDRLNTEQINTSIDTLITANWRARLNIERSISEGETNEAEVALAYQALCWSVELASQYTPTDTSFMLIFNLANIGSPIGFNY